MLLLSRTGFPVLSARLTLAITWPQGAHGGVEILAVAAQVNGGVIRQSIARARDQESFILKAVRILSAC
jgi:hypothetical protein